jgi:hypothetical protein
VTLHLEEGLDLADSQVFPVTEGDQLVEGAKQLVGILEDLPLVQALARASDHLGEEVKGIDVLQNVGLLVGDEDHVELIQGLVHEANIVLLDCGMLGAAVSELGKGEQQGLESRSSHLME